MVSSKFGTKRKHRPGTKTISFDEDARKEFLTGLRKRKKERAQHARRKIALEVRAEKLKDREMRREERKERLGILDDDAKGEDEDEDEDEDEEDANAEQSTYVIGDTLTTTVVESLMDDPEGGVADAPLEDRPPKKKQKTLSWMGRSTDKSAGSTSSRSDDAKQRIMQKKFDLSKPLATIIPGYKAPVGLKKKKKVKKRKILSKKEKQAQRRPQRS